LNQDVLRQINEIQTYFQKLINEDNINIHDIFYELEAEEIQKYYERLFETDINFFRDTHSYHIWKNYIIS
jgi:hypothetical protein